LIERCADLGDVYNSNFMYPGYYLSRSMMFTVVGACLHCLRVDDINKSNVVASLVPRPTLASQIPRAAH